MPGENIVIDCGGDIAVSNFIASGFADFVGWDRPLFLILALQQLVKQLFMDERYLVICF